MEFIDIINNNNWDSLKSDIYSKTESDVRRALDSNRRGIEEFKALISPSAAPFLEEMAQKSMIKTQERFGKTIQLYIPLYLSNYCANKCIYCGFNTDNKIKRKVLNDEEIMKEVEVIKKFGYEHILLVAGEAPAKADVNYYKHVIEMIKPYFAQISLEVQPMEQDEYEILIEAGLNSVYVYQETYHKQNYPKYHLGGKKADFGYRIDTPERLGKANVHKIGVGCLLGLEDWRTDSLFTAMHVNYLEKKYWKTKYCISIPRLRPHAGSFEPNSIISDRELVQLICAYRLCNQELEISISVRESHKFRDNIIKLGVTSMSAGSKTDPGGYSACQQELEQFEVHDDRTPAEIEDMIHNNGYEAVWKDWDQCYS